MGELLCNWPTLTGSHYVGGSGSCSRTLRHVTGEAGDRANKCGIDGRPPINPLHSHMVDIVRLVRSQTWFLRVLMARRPAGS
ncbi:hypothetical protein EXN66_Car016060 [Channa argus]|uniref:Uncharacterized protein n=1 Tax=Channa argus TaxID=215402 RepID=A0A6G1QDG7_CHAAH|nr:hypothetical protein EXN66_Car016060 [Channa argus]